MLLQDNLCNLHFWNVTGLGLRKKDGKYRHSEEVILSNMFNVVKESIETQSMFY